MNIQLQDCQRTMISDDYLNMKFTFGIKHKNSTYYFQAANSKERNDWLREIKIQMSNCEFINEYDEINYEKHIRHIRVSILDFNLAQPQESVAIW
jgi:hypothetical protein